MSCTDISPHCVGQDHRARHKKKKSEKTSLKTLFFSFSFKCQQLRYFNSEEVVTLWIAITDGMLDIQNIRQGNNIEMHKCSG